MWGTRTLRTLANEESSTTTENNPLTSYEPNDLHISETTDFFIQESSSDGNPLNLHDLEFDDYTIGRALSSPLFTQEREEKAGHRQAYHFLESLLSSQSSSVGHVRTGRPVSDQFDSLIPNVRENPRRDSENEQTRNLLERQKEQISLRVGVRVHYQRMGRKHMHHWRYQLQCGLRIQSDYNMNCNIQKERTLHLVLRLRGETERQDARHQ